MGRAYKLRSKLIHAENFLFGQSASCTGGSRSALGENPTPVTAGNPSAVRLVEALCHPTKALSLRGFNPRIVSCLLSPQNSTQFRTNLANLLVELRGRDEPTPDAELDSALKKLNRSMRLLAIGKIPELLEKLSKEAVEATTKIKGKLAEAQRVAAVVREAAEESERRPRKRLIDEVKEAKLK